MDKRVNKMVPLIFDLKTVSYVGYFILLAFAAVMISSLCLWEGRRQNIFASDDCVCSIGSWCIGLDTNPLYGNCTTGKQRIDIVTSIDGFKYGFLRMLRLFAIYTGFVLLLLYFIYSISDGDRLEYGIVDIFLIAGALFFVSGSE